jgi:hypothetical protein
MITKDIIKKKVVLINGVVLLILLLISYFYFYPRLFQPLMPGNFSGVVITMERTMCFGTCPAYKLTIYGDGRVDYEGNNYVGVIGKQTGKISQEEVKELVDKFYKIKFFSLNDEYTTVGGKIATDKPSTITSLTINGRTKHVKDNYGSPSSIINLEIYIDEITNSKKWVEGWKPESRPPT